MDAWEFPCVKGGFVKILTPKHHGFAIIPGYTDKGMRPLWAMKEESMEFRHEYKFQISPLDRQILLSRLRPLGLEDPHAQGGEYQVCSLYFDDLQDTALRQKLDGVEDRDKFRLRYYNGDLSFIRLEKKSKRGGLCQKRSARLTQGQAEAILAGRAAALQQSKDPLLTEFYTRLCAGLRPAALTAYRREPFVYAPGNVRITIDRDIRTGVYARCLDAAQAALVLAAAPDDMNALVLEVKYDAFLPDLIRQAIHLDGRPWTAFSKYAQCRRFG